MEKALRHQVIGVFLAADAVLVSAFLPWGTIEAKPAISGLPFPVPSSPFGDMTMRLTLTGWSGNMTLSGVTVPNWFTVILAFAAAGLAVLGATEVWSPPRWLPSVLASLGWIQVAGTLFVLMGGRAGSVGIGVLAALASFTWLLVGCLRLARQEVMRPS